MSGSLFTPFYSGQILSAEALNSALTDVGNAAVAVTSTVSSLSTLVDTTSAAEASDAAAIVVNGGSITTLTENLATLSATVNANSVSVSGFETSTSGSLVIMGGSIVTLSTEYATVSGNVNAVSGTVNTVSSNLNTVSAGGAANTAAISGLSTSANSGTGFVKLVSGFVPLSVLPYTQGAGIVISGGQISTSGTTTSGLPSPPSVSSGWTVYPTSAQVTSASTSTTITTTPLGGISFSKNGTNPSQNAGLGTILRTALRAVPTGNWSLTVGMDTFLSYQGKGGLAIQHADGSFRCFMQSMGSGVSNIGLTVEAWSSTRLFSNVYGFAPIFPQMGGYWKIVYTTAPTWQFWWSLDNSQWYLIYSDTLAATPSNYGLCVVDYNAGSMPPLGQTIELNGWTN